ncbi:MAG: hypothetical protein V3T59_02655 [Desulfobacterales bacterium]
MDKPRIKFHKELNQWVLVYDIPVDRIFFSQNSCYLEASRKFVTKLNDKRKRDFLAKWKEDPGVRVEPIFGTRIKL